MRNIRPGLYNCKKQLHFTIVNVDSYTWVRDINDMTNNKPKQMFVDEKKEFQSDEVNDDSNHNSTSIVNKQHELIDHNQHQQQNHHQEPISNQYNVDLHFDSIIPEAGSKTMLNISVTEKSGTPVREFELVHDKFMHLIIVGEDLSYFAHIHPTLVATEGNFTINHIFPESGNYKLWVDFKPKGGNQTLITFMADVKGLPTHSPRMPVYDGVFIKESSDSNYQISLKLSQETIIAKEDTDIVFNISDASGNPVMDLEPLMGAGGHSVIISSDIQEFLHVHPTDEVEPDWKGGPHIAFRTSFPKPGLYKVWGQFQHKGKTIMADFILEVA
jgi:hypothetical protein